MNVEQLLNKLSKAVSYTYRKDGTCPGVLISTLKDGDVYISIVRYGKEYPNGKKVVCKYQSSNLKTSLMMVSKLFIESSIQEQNPIESLRNELIEHHHVVAKLNYNGANDIHDPDYDPIHLTDPNE